MQQQREAVRRAETHDQVTARVVADDRRLDHRANLPAPRTARSTALFSLGQRAPNPSQRGERHPRSRVVSGEEQQRAWASCGRVRVRQPCLLMQPRSAERGAADQIAPARRPHQPVKRTIEIAAIRSSGPASSRECFPLVASVPVSAESESPPRPTDGGDPYAASS
jgi:hypothetical protein